MKPQLNSMEFLNPSNPLSTGFSSFPAPRTGLSLSFATANVCVLVSKQLHSLKTRGLCSA